MTEDADWIDAFLLSLKQKGWSSPTGIHWQRFCEHLLSCSGEPASKPPIPLILAASAESDASKQWRLREQLLWAADHKCLEGAIQYLSSLSEACWNVGTPENWEKSFYPGD